MKQDIILKFFIQRYIDIIVIEARFLMKLPIIIVIMKESNKYVFPPRFEF